jgi:hypothetical protein
VADSIISHSQRARLSHATSATAEFDSKISKVIVLLVPAAANPFVEQYGDKGSFRRSALARIHHSKTASYLDAASLYNKLFYSG